MKTSYNKVPTSLRLTPIQWAALFSVRYSGKVSIIIRFFIDKLVNDQLPKELKQELLDHLKDDAA